MFKNIFKSAIQGGEAPKIQDTLANLMEKIGSAQGAQIDKGTMATILSYTKTVDDSGELMLALTKYMDHHAEDSVIVFKCMKIVYFCLKLSHENFLPVVQAFLPEIQANMVLSFQKRQVLYREHIHILTISIYNHVITGSPLIDGEQLGLEKFGEGNQVRTPNPQGAIPQNAAAKLKNEQFQAMVAEPAQEGNALNSMLDWSDNAEDELAVEPEQKEEFKEEFEDLSAPPKPQMAEEDKPRLPGAFGGPRATNFGGTEGVSLLGFDDEPLNNDGDSKDMEEEKDLLFADFSERRAEKKKAEADLFAEFSMPASSDNIGFAPIDGESHPAPGGVLKPQKSGDFAPIDFNMGTQSGGGFAPLDDGDTFDPFAQIQSQPQKAQEKKLNPTPSGSFAPLDDGNTFDPFGQQPPAKAPKSGSFAPLELGDGDTFDPFGQPQPPKKMNPTPSGSFAPITEGDTFDPFGQPAPARDASRGSFEPIGAAASTFDPFATVAASKGATISADTFDPFSGAKQPSKSGSASFEPLDSGETFDPFGGASKPASKEINDTFDPFAGSAPASKDINDTFDPFAGSAAASKPASKPASKDINDTFDPFGGSSKPATKDQSETFDPFAGSAPSKPSSGSAFDMLSKPAPSPKASQNAFDILSAPSKGDDTFDPFGQPSAAPKPASPGSAFDILSQPSSKPSSSASAFDMLGAPSKPSGDVFGMLSSPSSTKATPPSSQNAFDMLSQPAPKTSQNAFDMLGGSFDALGSSPKPSPAASKSPSKTSSINTADTFDPFSPPSSQPSSRPQSPAGDIFDPFAGALKPSQAFDPYANKPQKADAFDPFGIPAAQNAQPKPASRGAFAPIDNNDVFDPFAAPKQPSFAPVDSKVKNSSSFSPIDNSDVFDPFASTEQPATKSGRFSISKTANPRSQPTAPQDDLLGF